MGVVLFFSPLIFKPYPLWGWGVGGIKFELSNGREAHNIFYKYFKMLNELDWSIFVSVEIIDRKFA